MIAADNCVIDQVTGSFSFFNLIDAIQVAGTPFFLQRMSIASLFIKETGDQDLESCKLHIALKGGKIFEQDQEVNFQNNTSNNRNLTVMQGLIIPEVGSVEISYSKNGNKLASWTIDIMAIQAPVVNAVPQTDIIKRKTSASNASKTAKRDASKQPPQP